MSVLFHILLPLLFPLQCPLSLSVLPKLFHNYYIFLKGTVFLLYFLQWCLHLLVYLFSSFTFCVISWSCLTSIPVINSHTHLISFSTVTILLILLLPSLKPEKSLLALHSSLSCLSPTDVSMFAVLVLSLTDCLFTYRPVVPSTTFSLSISLGLEHTQLYTMNMGTGHYLVPLPLHSILHQASLLYWSWQHLPALNGMCVCMCAQRWTKCFNGSWKEAYNELNYLRIFLPFNHKSMDGIATSLSTTNP